MELREIGTDVYACLQEDRGLGTSNSGLVNRGGGLVVDTFWDLPHTRDLIAQYARVWKQPARRVVNTHHNGDHCWGNQLFAERRDHRPPAVRRVVRQGAPRGDAGDQADGGVERRRHGGLRPRPGAVRLLRHRAHAADDADRRPPDARPRRRARRPPLRRPGAHRRRRDRPSAGTADRLHRRRAVPPLHADRLGRHVRQLDRRARPHRRARAGGGRARPRPALRRRGAARDARLPRVRARRVGARVRRRASRCSRPPSASTSARTPSWTEPERLVFNVARAYRECRGEPYDAPSTSARSSATCTSCACTTPTRSAGLRAGGPPVRAADRSV